MDYQHEISEEILNAFIDGEMESEDKIDILRQLSNSPELTQRVCELIRTKELLRSAYRDVVPPVTTSMVGSGYRRNFAGHAGKWGALAASLLVGLALFKGPAEQAGVVPASVSGHFSPVVLQQAQQEDTMRIIFHLTSANPLRMGRLLDNVDLMLGQARSAQQPAVIEVIANGEGLNLFRDGVTSFAERIHEMSKQNSNLRFIACQRTIDQLESGGEGKIRLLPDVVRAGSGISQVIQRQQQGWSYIQI